MITAPPRTITAQLDGEEPKTQLQRDPYHQADQFITPADAAEEAHPNTLATDTTKQVGLYTPAANAAEETYPCYN